MYFWYWMSLFYFKTILFLSATEWMSKSSCLALLLRYTIVTMNIWREKLSMSILCIFSCICIYVFILFWMNFFLNGILLVYPIVWNLWGKLSITNSHIFSILFSSSPRSIKFTFVLCFFFLIFISRTNFNFTELFSGGQNKTIKSSLGKKKSNFLSLALLHVNKIQKKRERI